MDTSDWNALAIVIEDADRAIAAREGNGADYAEGWRDALRSLAYALQPGARTTEDFDKIIADGRAYLANGCEWPRRDVSEVHCLLCDATLAEGASLLLGNVPYCRTCYDRQTVRPCSECGEMHRDANLSHFADQAVCRPCLDAHYTWCLLHGHHVNDRFPCQGPEVPLCKCCCDTFCERAQREHRHPFGAQPRWSA